MPFFDANSVELALAQTNQAEKYILSVGKSPIITFENIMPCLTRASLGSVLNMAELLKVASFIHNALYAKKTLSKCEDDIIPNRFQPREVFDDQALKELAYGTTRKFKDWWKNLWRCRV